MRATTILCATFLMLVTACSTPRRSVTSVDQHNTTHLKPSPAGEFILGSTSSPQVRLAINPDGTYLAEHNSPVEFWVMMEGNKVYPQRIKPLVEKGRWTWNRTNGKVTLTPETVKDSWWAIDRLRFDPARPDQLLTDLGAVLKRIINESSHADRNI